MALSPDRCYALRNLSPFTGVVQVMEQGSARAFSVDGVNWEIQVLAEAVNSIWSMPPSATTERQYYRYGVWSAKEGIAQLRVNPVLDIGSLCRAGDGMLRLLEQRHGAVPLPLEDRYELWLLDEGNLLPLALLDSAREQPQGRPPVPVWQATRLQERAFPCRRQEPAALSATGADRLEHQAHRRAGSLRQAQWFLRQTGGSGLGLGGRIPARLQQRRLPPEAFPELLLREDWATETEERLARDYFDWLAPRLLTLQGLGRDTRARLEQAASGQARLVAGLYRLFPEVVDAKWLNAIRVQAELLRSV